MSVSERFADDLTREERMRFLRHVYDKIDEQVRYSNLKANYILTAVGAVFVGCGAALMSPQGITSDVAKALLVAGLVLSSLSGGAASIAIFPVMRRRPGVEPPRSVMFFGAIAAMTAADYAEKVSGLTEGEMIEEISGQIHVLSKLCQEKYYWIRVSTMTLAIGMVLLFAAFTAVFIS